MASAIDGFFLGMTPADIDGIGWHDEEQRIYPLVRLTTAPRLIPEGADPRVAELTLEDLVTLRAGLVVLCLTG